MICYSKVNMSLEKIFLNLTPKEFEQARKWYDHLREPEKDRILKTLGIINNEGFVFEDIEPSEVGVAVIVGGSSIDTDTYSDIDLFLLTERTVYPKYGYTGRTHPKKKAGFRLEGKLPDFVYYRVYGETGAAGERTGLTSEPAAEELLRDGFGAKVTISLFYELVKFDLRRNDHPDDLLEPSERLGAEEIIKFNREQASKFLVLSRQYSISKDTS